MNPHSRPPTTRAHHEPAHACDLCGHPAVMLCRATQEWLCTPCYILAAVIRTQRIEDPIAVRDLAQWLMQRTTDHSHR